LAGESAKEVQMKRQARAIRILILLMSALVMARVGSADCRFISPESTDPAIRAWLDDHFVCYEAGAGAHERLFLFLPGTTGRPDMYTTLCKEAALAGLHAINLSYTNDKAVEWTYCRESDEDDCTGKVRLEQLEGKDYSREIEIDRANSIENRLIKLLRYLDEHFPEEDWDRYLTEEGDLEWERIVVSGHSQGGGHALMIGTHRKVARVVMFAWVDFHKGELAKWITPDTTTPLDRIYAIRHLEDRIEHTREVWRKLDLYRFGPEVDVDEADPPYSNTHLLVSSMDTSAVKAMDDRYSRYAGHMIIITDDHTPVDEEGRPLLAEMWRYMMGVVE
jgi:hypothetical protein